MSIEELENLKKDKNKSKWGGARDNSGRKKGKTDKTKIKEQLIEEQFKEFVSKEDIRELIKIAVLMAKSGNTAMLKFVLEQLFGKAPQGIDLTTKGEKVNMVFYLPEKK